MSSGGSLGPGPYYLYCGGLILSDQCRKKMVSAGADPRVEGTMPDQGIQQVVVGLCAYCGTCHLLITMNIAKISEQRVRWAGSEEVSRCKQVEVRRDVNDGHGCLWAVGLQVNFFLLFAHPHLKNTPQNISLLKIRNKK